MNALSADAIRHAPTVRPSPRLGMMIEAAMGQLHTVDGLADATWELRKHPGSPNPVLLVAVRFGSPVLGDRQEFGAGVLMPTESELEPYTEADVEVLGIELAAGVAANIERQIEQGRRRIIRPPAGLPSYRRGLA